MQTLGMAGGQFQIDICTKQTDSAHGVDQIEYQVSTNAGQPFKALAKTASGGELARISLAIQSDQHRVRCLFVLWIYQSETVRLPCPVSAWIC